MTRLNSSLLITYRLGNWDTALARALSHGNVHVWISFGLVTALLVVIQIVLIIFG